MAEILPFRAFRYTPEAGDLKRLLTQPYDKITPEMQARYLAASPYNYAQITFDRPRPGDSESDNVYTRAAARLRAWISEGILAQDPEPAFYPYYQEFRLPESGERITRKGFIGLGPVVDYGEGVVFRHEQTLAGPKKDRLELLRATKAHTGQLFLLYSDPEFAVEALLEEAASQAPLIEVEDEYGVLHRVWRIADPPRTAEITRLMGGKKLLIADGHHRYETALAYARENPECAAARRVMMTLVNLHSPGLKVLATHRLLRGLADFNPENLLHHARRRFHVLEGVPVEMLRDRLAASDPSTVRIGFAAGAAPRTWLLERERAPGELDVAALHSDVLHKILGIDEEAMREQRHILYQRGLRASLEQVREGRVQAAFLLPPTPVEQVAEVAFSGGVMPQKSTDFYPKLLDGLTTYVME